jgi:hypothetical protein
MKLQFVDLCDDEVGEVQAFFKDGELLAAWSSNDANWRSEYMDPLLEELGWEIEYASSDETLAQKLREMYL